MEKTLLLILDGFGIAPKDNRNAIYSANAPTLHSLLSFPETMKIDAAGRAVGLPSGYMGNSEVGHLNIGAGVVVYQDMTKIDVAIEDGTFFDNPVIEQLLTTVKQKKGRVHFMGLLSDAGVHSHIAHLEALLKKAYDESVPAYVHAFMDGRDTAPNSGVNYIEMLNTMLMNSKAKLATICGRFYAMDRDKRWERIEEAYNLLVCGDGQQISDPISAIKEAYSNEEFDEFIKPRILDKNGIIKDNDAIFFFNFRADRGKELAMAFTDATFNGFERKKLPILSAIASMTAYDSSLSFPVAYPKENLQDTLGEKISNMGIRQLRIAETEKYAHVTYFFNGGKEEPFPNEERVLIPSPKEVATYDEKPQMSILPVTEKLLESLASDYYGFIVCNLANPDMLGHTGVMKAAIEALEYVDTCVEQILSKAKEYGWRVVFTADHGNVEEMIDENGTAHTAHTLNQVPLLLLECGEPKKLDNSKYTKLADIAKLILE